MPIIATAFIDCDTSIWPLMASMVFLRLLTPSTVAICAICEVSSAFSIGFSGSWFCNCVVSSFRNWSCRPCAVMELVEPVWARAMPVALVF
ncbi:hypothetical protein D3C87_1625740 [compost metagenome]